MARQLGAIWRCGRDWRRPLAGGVALSLLALSVLCGIRSFPRQPRSRGGGDNVDSKPPWSASQQLEENPPDDLCSGYPYVRMKKVLHNNLGYQGPDAGSEGLVIEAMGKYSGKSLRMLVVLNATSAYTCKHNVKNGISGIHGAVNLKSGTKVGLRISFRDAATNKRLRIPNLALTFFDLDTARSGCAESITASGYSKYYLAKSTQVHVRISEETTFKATQHGDAKDNPTDAVYMTATQQARSVSLLYSEPNHVDVTVAAEPGSGSRFLNFIVKPSLLCSKTIEDGAKYPLGELDFFPPLDTPIVAAADETFQDWFVEDGDIIEEGHTLCTVIQKNGRAKVYKSPKNGRVEIQQKIETGIPINTAIPARRILAVVTTPCWPPIKRKPEDMLAQSDVGYKFKKFHAKRGDMVKKGKPLVELEDENGKSVMLRSKGVGVVKKRQDNFSPGDPVERALDRVLMTVGKFSPLPVKSGDGKTDVIPNMKFERWRANVGDVVTWKTPIVDVRDVNTDKFHDVKATKDGILILRQEGLRWGMKVDEVMMDRNLAVIGKFPPLRVRTGEKATNAHPGMIFVQYNVKKDDYVTPTDEVAVVEVREGAEKGEKLALKPNIAGVVTATHHRLQQGMSIDESLPDLNLMTIGKFRALEVGMEKKAVQATSPGATFIRWRVETGSVVNRDDPIAEVRDSTEMKKILLSPKYGILESRQEKLKKDMLLSDVMEDQTLAVVGKFPPISPGFLQTGVEAPDGAVFQGWLVKDGDQVTKGQPIAKVVMPERRRLKEGRPPTEKLVTGESHNVTAPSSGSIQNLQPLEAGSKIEDAQSGSTIATVGGSLPVMQVIAILVCICLWICFLGLFKVMRKHKPIYNHLLYDDTRSDTSEYPVDESNPVKVKERPNQKQEKEGLKLDFMDKNSGQLHGEHLMEEQEYIRTYHAHYRPLGIKSERDKAPIVAEAFFINSYAHEKLRIRQHSTLVGIDDIDVREMNFEETNRLLDQRLKKYPVYPLRIRFQDKDGRAHLREFTERPIGIQFTSDAPIQVSHVDSGSPAAMLSETSEPVQVGWYIVGIGNEDVSKTTSFKEVMEYIKQGVSLLPYKEDNFVQKKTHKQVVC